MWDLDLNLEKVLDVIYFNVLLFWCFILLFVNFFCFLECILINVEEI